MLQILATLSVFAIGDYQVKQVFSLERLEQIELLGKEAIQCFKAAEADLAEAEKLVGDSKHSAAGFMPMRLYVLEYKLQMVARTEWARGRDTHTKALKKLRERLSSLEKVIAQQEALLYITPGKNDGLGQRLIGVIAKTEHVASRIRLLLDKKNGN